MKPRRPCRNHCHHSSPRQMWYLSDLGETPRMLAAHTGSPACSTKRSTSRTRPWRRRRTTTRNAEAGRRPRHALTSRFEHRKRPEDLAEAIEVAREALDVAPAENHLMRLVCYTTLVGRAAAALLREPPRGGPGEAVASPRRALRVARASGAGMSPMATVNLATGLTERFVRKASARTSRSRSRISGDSASDRAQRRRSRRRDATAPQHLGREVQAHRGAARHRRGGANPAPRHRRHARERPGDDGTQDRAGACARSARGAHADRERPRRGDTTPSRAGRSAMRHTGSVRRTRLRRCHDPLGRAPHRIMIVRVAEMVAVVCAEAHETLAWDEQRAYCLLSPLRSQPHPCDTEPGWV
jgi:hypothetical protein